VTPHAHCAPVTPRCKHIGLGPSTRARGLRSDQCICGPSHGYREGPPSKLYHEIHWTARFLPDDLDDIALAGLLIEMMFFYLARLLAALPLRSKCLAISRLRGRRPRRHPVRSPNCPGKVALASAPSASSATHTGHLQGWARARSTSSRRKRDMPDLRAVVPSRLRIHYR
jgi:hypothetical protein